MKKTLKARTIAVGLLNEDNLREMFALFEMFYDNVSFDRFKSDLRGKKEVILMKDQDKKIKGFSTLLDFPVTHEGKKYHILYSGDTIIAPEHWGTPVLTMAFLKELVKIRVRHPLSHTWWLLLSKGFKTYLLLANNFIDYYPKPQTETPPELRSLMATLSEKLYPGKFNPERGVIEFKRGEHERLKEHVAPITPDILAKSEKIRFFHELNPDWQLGNELVCLGRIELPLAIFHPLKILTKKFRR